MNKHKTCVKKPHPTQKKKYQNGIGIVKYANKRCLAKCNTLLKYHLDTERWEKPQEEEKGKAFSIVRYNTDFGKRKQQENFESFIMIGGMRPENYSTNGKSGNVTGFGISNFLSILDQSDKRIKCESVLVDNDGPLEQEAKVLANHINRLKEERNCKKIHVLGISKGGCIATASLKYLEDSNLDKLNVITYQAPFLGTIFASPIALYKRVDELVGSVSDSLLKRIIPILQKIRPETSEETQPPNNALKILKKIHWDVFSQSHMDYDISIMNEAGVPKKHLNRYDKDFLTNMFDEKTLTMLKQVNFINVTTSCSEETLKRALETGNINALMLYLSSKTIFKGKVSDGMVEEKSSKYIEKICDENNIDISKVSIPNGHHDIASDVEIINSLIRKNVLNYEQKEHDSR